MFTRQEAVDVRFMQVLEKALLVRLVQAGVSEAEAEAISKNMADTPPAVPPGMTSREFMRLLADAIAHAEAKAAEDEAWYKANMPDA